MVSRVDLRVRADLITRLGLAAMVAGVTCLLAITPSNASIRSEPFQQGQSSDRGSYPTGPIVLSGTHSYDWFEPVVVPHRAMPQFTHYVSHEFQGDLLGPFKKFVNGIGKALNTSPTTGQEVLKRLKALYDDLGLTIPVNIRVEHTVKEEAVRSIKAALDELIEKINSKLKERIADIGQQVKEAADYAIKMARQAMIDVVDKVFANAAELWGIVYSDLIKVVDRIFAKLDEFRIALASDVEHIVGRATESLRGLLDEARKSASMLGVVVRESMRSLSISVLTISETPGVLYLEPDKRIDGPTNGPLLLQMIGGGCGQGYVIKASYKCIDSFGRTVNGTAKVKHQGKHQSVLSIPADVINATFNDTKETSFDIIVSSYKYDEKKKQVESREHFQTLTKLIKLPPRMPIVYRLKVKNRDGIKNVEYVFPELFEENERDRFRANFMKSNPNASENARNLATALRLGKLSELRRDRLPIGTVFVEGLGDPLEYTLEVSVDGGSVFALTHLSSYLNLRGYEIKASPLTTDARTKRLQIDVTPTLN